MIKKNILDIKLSPYIFYSFFAFLLLIAIFSLIIFYVPEGNFIIIQRVIGDKYALFSLAVATLFISGANLALAWATFKKDKVASHIFGALAVLIPAIILLKVASVIFMH